MTDTIKATGFVVADKRTRKGYDFRAIWGIGRTADEALADFEKQAAEDGWLVLDAEEPKPVGAKAILRRSTVEVYKATTKLRYAVGFRVSGGIIDWEIVRGIACTGDEADTDMLGLVA